MALWFLTQRANRVCVFHFSLSFPLIYPCLKWQGRNTVRCWSGDDYSKRKTRCRWSPCKGRNRERLHPCLGLGVGRRRVSIRRLIILLRFQFSAFDRPSNTRMRMLSGSIRTNHENERAHTLTHELHTLTHHLLRLIHNKCHDFSLNFN
jgi:hypothetical protein